MYAPREAPGPTVPPLAKGSIALFRKIIPEKPTKKRSADAERLIGNPQKERSAAIPAIDFPLACPQQRAEIPQIHITQKGQTLPERLRARHPAAARIIHCTCAHNIGSTQHIVRIIIIAAHFSHLLARLTYIMQRDERRSICPVGILPEKNEIRVRASPGPSVQPASRYSSGLWCRPDTP